MPRPWMVTRHDPIQKHEENLWSVEGDVPGLPGISRRMAIVRLDDGRLLFYNAIPLEEPLLAEVTALGRPALLVIPHRAHCIDGVAFREKLGLTVYAPRSDAKLGARIQVDHDISELPADPAIECRAVAGTKLGEPLLIVGSGPDHARKTLIFSDALMNVPPAPGVRGRIFQLMGFTGVGPRVAGPFKLLFVNDKDALRKDYARWIEMPGVARLMPSHGAIIEREPVQALKQAAATI